MKSYRFLNSKMIFLYCILLTLLVNEHLSININTPKPDNKYVLDLTRSQNNQLLTTISLGSNYEQMNVAVSTSSSLNWLKKEDSNKSIKGYSADSTDFRTVPEGNKANIKKINYSKGELEGTFAKDLLSLTNEAEEEKKLLTLGFNFFFAGNLNNTADEPIYKYSGALGLGLDTPSQNFVHQLNTQGNILSQRFSMYISHHKSINSKLYVGDFSKGTLISSIYQQLSYCKVADDSTSWSCELSKIDLNKTSITSTSKIQIDTSVENLIIPLIDYRIIKKHLMDMGKTECVRNEVSQLACKCQNVQIFPDFKLHIGMSSFNIPAKNLIDYNADWTYQCKFKITIDLDVEDTWSLGTQILADTFLSFDISKRTLGFIQSPTDLNYNLNSENIFLKTDQQEAAKLGYIFTFVILLILFYGLTRCSDNEEFMSGNFRNSFGKGNDDKKKMELIKNKFNTDEYDYDQVKGVSSELKGKKIIEMKEFHTDIEK